MIFRYRIEWEIAAESLADAKLITEKFRFKAPDEMTATMEVLEAVEESLVKEPYE